MTITRAVLAAALSAFLATVAAEPARAQDVTLTSRDGAIHLQGTLLGFDGEFYRVETGEHGIVTLDATAVSCAGPGCPSLTDFVAEFAFSGTPHIVTRLMPLLLRAFARAEGLTAGQSRIPGQDVIVMTLSEPEAGHDVARIRLRPAGPADAFADLLAGEADGLIALDALSPDRRARARAAGLGDLDHPLRVHVLALDALVPIVPADSPARTVSLPALRAALGGDGPARDRLTSSDDGRPRPGPLALVVPSPRHAAGAATVRLLLGAGVRPLPPDIVTLESPQEVIDAIAGARPAGNVLGITTLSALEGARGGARGAVRPVPLSDGCGFVIRATRERVKTGDYPLTLPVLLYRPAVRLPQLGRRFMAFLESRQAQLVIRRAGLVDQAGETLPLSSQGERLANAIRAAEGAEGLAELKRVVAALALRERLSLTFRFRPDSRRLDIPSRAHLARLARQIGDGRFRGRSLLLAGHAVNAGDNPGEAEADALARAESVRKALAGLFDIEPPDSPAIEVAGFGGAIPLTCSDSNRGRQINRRVEVWLR